MNFVSIDIETTGLDPNLDQILEVAAIRSWDLASASWIIKWDRIAGHPFALHRNSKLLDPSREGIKIGELESNLIRFLEPEKYGIASRPDDPKRRFVIAGKNFGKFDWQFLNRYIDMEKYFFHRVLDPAMFWMRPDDLFPPTLEVCCERAKIAIPEDLHTALADANMVLRLLIAGCPDVFRLPGSF